MIIHEESLFGTGTANLLAKELPGYGFEVKEVIKHANPTRDFNNIVLRMKALNPDIVIPANYYNEYALLVRTMQQQKVQPKAIYSVLGGAASSYKFLKEFPDAADGIIDCNHWFNPKDKRALDLRKRVVAARSSAGPRDSLTLAALGLVRRGDLIWCSRDNGAPLLDGLRRTGESFYFVHSFYPQPADDGLAATAGVPDPHRLVA